MPLNSKSTYLKGVHIICATFFFFARYPICATISIAQHPILKENIFGDGNYLFKRIPSQVKFCDVVFR